MSGPKVITYSMNAFEGRLKEIMRLQSRLSQMQSDMLKACIHDENLNIHYDCSDSYKKIEKDIEKSLQTIVFDYKGTINKATYDTIQNQINTKNKELQEVLKKAEFILTDFDKKQKDYDSYTSYLGFVDNAKASFEKFKKDVNTSTEESFAKDNKTFVEEAQMKYGQIEFEKQSTDFKWGFDNLAEAEKNNIIGYLQDKEEEVKEIRKEMLDKIISTNPSPKKLIVKKKTETKSSPEIQRVSQKIEMLINNCNEKEIVAEYISSFSKLKESESMNDLFFYQELHDSILEKENTRKNKLSINKIMAKLNKLEPDSSLITEKSEILQKAVNLIDSSRVNEKEFKDLKGQFELLVKKNRQSAEEAEIKRKEQHFIKSQIIMNFENMGYEVMDDLEVIDFEKETDYYLMAPGQENLLHIKFKDDGSLRYVFEIPQKKESLSVDEQKLKLHEMKTTCDDFVNVLNDLKKMGVDIDIKSEKPIELASMITISESITSKFNLQKEHVQRKQQIKKLYLD